MATNKKVTAKSPKRRMSPLWVAVLSMFVVELLFYTWCRVQCTRTGYLITEESNRNQELKMVRNSLNIELARLKAPENISRVARNKLGMGMPEPQQIVLVP